MSYTNDAFTRALYNLGVGGTNLQGNAAWNLTSTGGGTWSLTPTISHLITLATDVTIEREVVATAAPGTILELGAWGETEAVNIQLVIGWDADRRLFVGWERGEGIDYVLTGVHALPVGADVKVAVTIHGTGGVEIIANGVVLADRTLPIPTGGLHNGNPTPGMRLSVGRRVSASDPMTYAGGGWLRISARRTIAEIQAAWAAEHVAPILTGLTWDELSRRDDADPYYVFRGQYRAHASSPGALVAWATRHVHTPFGLLEGRLLTAPGSIAMGIPETPGAPPERTNASLTLDNADGALTEMFAGGWNPATQYGGDSLLSLTGKIYLGYVGRNGVAVERAVSPTLVAIGTPTMGEATISVQLATDDARILGPTKKMVTVRAVKDGDFAGSGLEYDSSGRAHGAFTDVAFDALRGVISESLDTVVPYAYGLSPIPLVRVSEQGHYFAYVSMHNPAFPSVREWRLHADDARTPVDQTNIVNFQLWRLWSVKIQVLREDGDPQQVWLVGVRMDAPSVREFVDGAQVYLTPAAEANVGVPVLGSSGATPARIIRQIIADLSDAGASAIDEASFAAASLAVPMPNACGGVVRSSAALAEILTHVAGPWGLAVWIDTDDLVHVMRPAGWSVDDKTGAAGALPLIGLTHIVEGSFAERMAAPEEIGGAARRVSIDWSSEQQGFWPAPERPATAPGMTQLALAGEPEARISGAWVYPPRYDEALSGIAARRAFVYRRVSVALPPWVLAYSLGSMFRLSHPFGAAQGGYANRLVRLVRRECMPGEDSVRCELVDLGALELLRPGKLDSAANWVEFNPGASGVKATFTAGSDVVTFDADVVDSRWMNCSLWAFGSAVASLRRSHRVVEILTKRSARLREPAGASGVVVSTASPPHRAPWIVMRNRTSHPDHRPDYITVADEATGRHSDGGQGFVFTA